MLSTFQFFKPEWEINAEKVNKNETTYLYVFLKQNIRKSWQHWIKVFMIQSKVERVQQYTKVCSTVVQY